MISKDDCDKLERQLTDFLDEVGGTDEIMDGILNRLVSDILANHKLLWFYNEALRARRAKGMYRELR